MPNAGVGQEVVEVLGSDLIHLVGVLRGGDVITQPDVVWVAVIRAILPTRWWALWRYVVDCRGAHEEGGEKVELHRVPGPGVAAAT